MITSLRPYQQSAVDDLRLSYASGHRRPLLQLPTGAGKTIIFCAVAAGARRKRKRVLVVAHRRELIRQASAKLTAAGVPHGLICPGFDPAPDEPIQVGSVQTLSLRLDSLPQFDVIVFDEAHHCCAPQYTDLIASQPRARLLGCTATPTRLDGRGLGVADGGPFDDLIVCPSVADLQRDGFLCLAAVFAPEHCLDLRGACVRGGDYVTSDLTSLVDRPGVTGDAVDEYRRRADHQAAIAFCVSVEHAEHVAESFRDAGYRSCSVDGAMPRADRDAAIAGLATGEIEVLTSCDLISEGLDVPAVGAVILLRPTKSLVLYMQQVGRGMRPTSGKNRLVVLDHVGNVLEHGLPDADRTWSLAGGGRQGQRSGSVERQAVWRCPCGCINATEQLVCASCAAGKPGARAVHQQPGQLTEVTADRLRAARGWSFREMASLPRSEAELRVFAVARGYRPQWVHHRLREQASGFAAGGMG